MFFLVLSHPFARYVRQIWMTSLEFQFKKNAKMFEIMERQFVPPTELPKRKVVSQPFFFGGYDDFRGV